MNTWHCSTCDKTLKKSSKYKHLSKSHSQNSNKAIECDLCLTESKNFKNCVQCIHSWCSDCHTKMDKCPFCRKPFPGQRIPNDFYVVSFEEVSEEPWEPERIDLTIDLTQQPDEPIDRIYVQRFEPYPPDYFLNLEEVLELERYVNWLNSAFA